MAQQLRIWLEQDNVEEVARLLEKDSTYSNQIVVPITHERPLHIVAWYGSIKMAQLLLQKGADIQARTISGTTPLHKAAARDRSDMIQVLLRSGANVDGGTSETMFYTPLHYAAGAGALKAVRVLVENGADINAPDRYEGVTPLGCAASQGRYDVVVYLLEKGADPTIKDRRGMTAYDIATKTENQEVANLLRSVETMQAGPSQGEEKTQEPKPEEKGGE